MVPNHQPAIIAPFPSFSTKIYVDSIWIRIILCQAALDSVKIIPHRRSTKTSFITYYDYPILIDSIEKTFTDCDASYL